MIQIDKAVAELRKETDSINRTDRRVINLRSLLDDVLTERPRWGRAISVKGFVSALLQQHDHAVEHFRAGIAAGDRSLQTRQMLLESLNAMERYDEAREEMNRMSMDVDFALDPYSLRDIRSAVNRGDLMTAVDAARDSVKENPKDANRLIVLAKVASHAVEVDSKKSDSGRGMAALTQAERDLLIEEARTAIRDAASLVGEDQFSISDALLMLEFRHGNAESVSAALASIETSTLPEHDKLVLKARVSGFRGNIDEATELLEQASALKLSVPTLIQLAKLYQVQGQSAALIDTLRRALKLDPKNASLRMDLAKAIVVYGGENPQWQEIEQLLGSGSDGSESDRLARATLLMVKGGERELLEAVSITRALVGEGNSNSYEASVVQASALVKLADLLSQSDQEPERERKYLDQARQIYERLASVERPLEIDLYRYGVLLLNKGSDDDLEKVQLLSDQLAVMPNGMVWSLQLGFAYLKRTGSDADIPKWMEGWAAKARPAQERRLMGSVEWAAGKALIELGFTEEGLAWLEKTDTSNPAMMKTYVASLVKAKQSSKAAKVCASHYEEHGDVLSATFLVETLLAMNSDEMDAKYAQTLEDAMQSHSNNAEFLESMATLAEQRGNPKEAVRLYLQVLDVEPLRVRALNNLAMAYTQIPGMAIEGIAPIDRALKLTKRNPELLDTKGTVLLCAGRSREALSIFDEALQAQDEPRYRFHKILALIALKKHQEANRLWDSLDLDVLDAKRLTIEEQQILETMKKDFDSFANGQT
jgi:tetratricopeptide (TPR) repeat protein